MGRGRRAGYYGALLMATYNIEEGAFESVCRLASGFTDKDLEGFSSLLGPHRIQKQHIRVRSLIDSDIYVSPEVLLEVASDEITLSPIHLCGRNSIRKDVGLALRFPRFTGKYRVDKRGEDATTSQEVIELYKRQRK